MIDLQPPIETVDTPTTELKICLLGLPLVTLQTGYLGIPRREVRAMLYYLANRLEPVAREQLCYLFWPDAPESTARRALSHLLTHLRNALPSSEDVVTCDDGVQLNGQRVWTDTAVFEKHCCTSMRERQLPLLQQGIDLYRGPFLSGFALNSSAEFEAWVVVERSRWERLYLEALAILIEKQTACGAYEAAITNARLYLHTNDLAEEVHRRLIELYAAIGNRFMAIRQFETCAGILSRELGLSPQPMTWAVYQVILEGGSPLTHPR
jgi:DNA-binding SARP family transcriptional activator